MAEPTSNPSGNQRGGAGGGGQTARTQASGYQSTQSFSNSASVPVPNDALIQPYMMSAEDCQALFSGEEAWDSLDLYFIDRCNSQNRLLVKAEHYTEEGVSFSFKYDGEVNASGSPADEYYQVRKASVDIEMTLRNGMRVPDIKSFLMLGQVEDQPSMRVHTITRSNTIRKRPPNYILIAVPEGEPPTPEVVGGYLFPNVSIDLANGLKLTHNPKDYQESQVKWTAKFTKGKEGVLSKVYVPK